MSIYISRKCDECGKIRGEANHWWAVVGSVKRPAFLTFNTADRSNKPGAFRMDYCSQGCVNTAFQRWMDTGSVRKARSRATALVSFKPVTLLRETEAIVAKFTEAEAAEVRREAVLWPRLDSKVIDQELAELDAMQEPFEEYARLVERRPL